jgi:magnesium transporter
MEIKEFSPELLVEAIKKRNVPLVRKYFEELNAANIAEYLNAIEDPAEFLFVFKTVPANHSGEVFGYLDPDVQERIVKSLNSDEINKILENVNADDVVTFLEELPSNLVKKILSSASKEMRTEINHLLNYSENSTGSLMTTEFVELKEKDSVEVAMRKIRRFGKMAETISYLFVVDASRRLVGTLRLKDLIFAENETLVEEIMERDFVKVVTSDDQEVAALTFKKYDLNAIPVVTHDERLVGIITADDIIDVIDQEATEDMQKMAAVLPLDEEYLKTPVLTLARKRIVWLLILMVSATFTGLIINSYESVLALLPALTMFIPMLMDTAGNSGGQTSTLVVRGLALGEIKTSDYLQVLTKEMGVALIAGLVLGVFNFTWILIQLNLGIINVTTTASPVLIAGLVGLSLFTTVFLAKSMGSTLPIVAKSLKLDPALMAGPLVTTIVDAMSLMIYFFLATRIFSLI